MLIGLHGKKQAGKDTVFDRAEWLMRDVLRVERASFADPMYASAAASLGVTVADLRTWKTDPTVRVRVTQPAPFEARRTLADLSIREYLQNYGTEAHRDVFGPNFWVDNVRLDDHEGRIVMVTDVRFENEAVAVIEAGGVVVRVLGPEAEGDAHASEAPLNDALVWGTIDNRKRDDHFWTLDGQVHTMLRLALQHDQEQRRPKPESRCGPTCNDYTGCDGGCRA